MLMSCLQSMSLQCLVRPQKEAYKRATSETLFLQKTAEQPGPGATPGLVVRGERVRGPSPPEAVDTF